MSAYQAILLLEQQQSKVKQRSAPWMVGEQLKDLCRNDPVCAQLIAQDLEVDAMSIVEAEKQIKAFADKHKTGSFACVTPMEAEDILRKFYGLPERKGEPEELASADRGVVLNLADFMR